MGMMDKIRDFINPPKKDSPEKDWAKYIENKAYEEERIKLAEKVGREKAKLEYENRNKKPDSLFKGGGSSLKDFTQQLGNNIDEFQKQNFGGGENGNRTRRLPKEKGKVHNRRNGRTGKNVEEESMLNSQLF